MVQAVAVEPVRHGQIPSLGKAVPARQVKCVRMDSKDDAKAVSLR